MTAHIAIVQAVPVNQIEVASFVRTSNGYDKGSLSELSASIKEHGLIQPIVVRPIGEGEGGSHAKFAIVAGRRRLAACKLAGITEVPAVVADTDESKAYELEIAENIQREAMTLHDTARAVRTLFMIHGNAKAVQRIVNKSSAWVSKHLTITADTFPALLVELLADGRVADLETLLIMAQIKRLNADPAAAHAFTRLLNKAHKGELSRADAKAELDKLKAKEAPKPSTEQSGCTEEGEEEGGEGSSDATVPPHRPKPVSVEKVCALIENTKETIAAALAFLGKKQPAGAADALHRLVQDLEAAKRFITEPTS